MLSRSSRRACAASVVLVFTVLALPAAAQVLWSYDENQSDPGNPAHMYGASNPASYLMGTLPGRGPFDQMAVEQHVLHPGDVVPLPTYPDGTVAEEQEIFWTVHLRQVSFSGCCCPMPARYQPGDNCSVGFSGRTYVGGSGAMENQIFCTPDHGLRAVSVDVVVTVIAVRPALAVSTSRKTIGGLKQRYR